MKQKINIGDKTKKSKAKLKKELFNTRTSWRWFESRIQLFFKDALKIPIEEVRLMLQVEILKELQFMNDKSL